MKLNRKYLILTALIIAFLLRLYLSLYPGYIYDMEHYKNWAIRTLHYGVSNVYKHGFCDYPPGFLYVLKCVGYIYRFIYHDMRDSMLFISLIKLPSIMCDLICACLLFYFWRKEDFKKGFSIFLLYLFNPFIIMDSSIWGQADSVALTLFFIAVLMALEKKYTISYIFMTITVLTKLQYSIYVPFIFAFNSRGNNRLKEIVRGVSISFITLFLFCFPHIYNHTFDKIVELFFSSPHTYSGLSLNAFNLGWIVSGGYGMDVSDNTLFLGCITYKKIGIILFFSVLGPVFSVFLSENNEENFILSLAITGFSFFMLLTRVHERYGYPLILFLAILFLKDIKYRIVYIILSVTMFLNLTMVMVTAFHDSGYSLLNFNYNIPLNITIVISWINFLMLIFLLFPLLRKCNMNIIKAIIIIALILIISDVKLMSESEVYLSQMPELKWEQSWGKGGKNMNIKKDRIFIGDYPYEYGISTHSNSKITYGLGKKYKFFKADIGLGNEVGRKGSVVFNIKLDGEDVYKSKIIRGTGKPLHIEIPLEGKEVMELLADDGGDGINYDHAIWANARLCKY